jgi:hypothetical protein
MRCDHAPSVDPRMKDCVRCGRPIPPAWERNIDAENRLVVHASPDEQTAWVVNTKRLRRSGKGWVRQILRRDFTREGDEEILDLVNYAVWRDQQRKIQGFDGLSAGQLHALSLFLEAYQWWHRTEDED